LPGWDFAIATLHWTEKAGSSLLRDARCLEMTNEWISEQPKRTIN